MIESIEGKRGMPRLRPPYVAQVGLFGRPTLEHNFETLYWVRDISRRAPPGCFRQGRNGRKGLRSFSVSGRVKNPGREARAGRHHHARADRRILRRHARRPHLLRLSAGRRLGRHPAGSMGDIPLDFDTLQPYGCFIGSAAVILSDHDTAKARRAT
jgi:NADH:ubiquinone oxidoreductase subunit F (NADH-binding)